MILKVKKCDIAPTIALFLKCIPPPQGLLARLAVEFDQGTSQVGDGPSALAAVNVLTDLSSASDVIAVPTVAAADALGITFKVEPDLAGYLTSSGEA